MTDPRTRHYQQADGATVPPRPANPEPDRPIDPATRPSKTPNPMTADLPEVNPENEDLEKDEIEVPPPEVPAPKHAPGAPRRETAQAHGTQRPIDRPPG